jgi:hypothetical protein
MSRIDLKHISLSHRAQLDGVDYQKAAYDAASSLPFEPTDDELQELESEPEPDCECPACRSAAWH